MHSHPATSASTVAVNALWCVLIALALLAFPLIARQARLQSGLFHNNADATSTVDIKPR